MHILMYHPCLWIEGLIYIIIAPIGLIRPKRTESCTSLHVCVSLGADKRSGIMLWRPIAGEHTEHIQIEKMVIEPFALLDNSLVPKTQALWNGAAARIAERAADHDFLHSQSRERVTHHHSTSFCHNAFPLEGGGEPVANLHLALYAIDGMVADSAGQLLLVPDAAGEAIIP